MTKFCLKCRRWKPIEGGSGSGRQYRCAGCSAGRRAGRQKAVLRDTFMRAVKEAMRESA